MGKAGKAEALKGRVRLEAARPGRDAERAEAEQAGLERLAGTRPGAPADYSRARVKLPRLAHGEAGTNGLGRGPVEAAEVSHMVYDARTGRHQPTTRILAQGRPPETIRRQPQHCRRAAEIYAALAEAVASPGGPADQVVIRAGISDGGATTRVAMAAALRRARGVIGEGVVLAPRRRDAVERRAITALALVDLLVIERRSISRVLADHGWARRASHAATLGLALREALDALAIEFGVISRRDNPRDRGGPPIA